MAANMPQMGGGGGVRQRPSHPQLSQLVYTQIVAQTIQTGGWQDQVQVNLRVSNAMNLISNSFLAMPTLDSQQLVNHGLSYEREAFLNSPDKGTYDQKINNKVQDLFKRRQAHEQSLQNSLNAQAAAQAHAQAQAQAQSQQMMMNPNMMPRGMGQMPQQGFQHLQQQMQPSPIPQQPHQPGMGMGAQGGLPMNPNQQPMPMGVTQMRPQMPMNAALASLPPQDRTKIMQLALAKLNQTSEPQRSVLRSMVQQKFSPQQMAQLQAENQDPLLFFLQIQMLQAFKGQGGGNGGGNQAALQMQAQQRQMSQPGQPMVGVPNSEFGPFSNVESIMNQQKAGLLAQEAGLTVVPASNGPGRNATPQPMGAMQGPNPGNHPGPNQPGIPNQMPPQHFNHPQAQQLKMDQRAAQSQAQIRAQAQAKQMQGQPGGLNGGGAISQSPGMNTLNTPVRHTPVMGQPEGQRQMGQPNGPYAPGIDPRFSQANQRQQMPMTNPHVINAILSQMAPEQRSAFMNLTPDKKNEMILKWTTNSAARAAAMGQAPGRGQPQPGQFGQGNPMAQFGPGNNMGQASNPAMQMNQNQMMIQQQMNRMRNNNMQPQNQIPIPHNVSAFMENLDVPTRILDQLKQNQPVPPEIKKWSQLKQWLSQKNASPQVMQQLQSFQNVQFQSMMKQRTAVANNQMAQPNMPQQGPQMPNGQMPMQQPGANMGPFAGITITPAELQQAKNHDKFKGWPDDKVRAALMQMKMGQMRAKANGQAPNAQMQTPQTTQPPNNAVSAPQPAPNNNLQGPQQQQQQQQQQQRPQNAGADINSAGSTVPARNSRQIQNNRPPPPANSAAPQKNNLKRASTDDLVEVPNPSGTPVQRPASQQAQVTGSLPTGHPSPAQLATLPPEQRSKIEAMMRSRQTAMAGGAGAQQPQMSEAMQHLKAIGQEEHVNAAKEPYHEIPMTPEQYQDMALKIQSMVMEMAKVSKILGRWYALTRDDNRARMFFKMRLRLAKQFADGEKMATLKKAFSLRPHELDSVRGMLEGMARDVANQFPQVMKRNATQQQHAQESGSQQQGAGESTATPPTGAPTPLNAANLEKQNAAMNKIHQRAPSKSGQTPAAPTNAHPPFPFGAQSPNGQPTYAGKPTVTQADLQLPARKRPRTSGQAGFGSGGASASSSPQVQKASSPELVKRQAENTTPKLAFQCPEPSCEAHRTGFATEEARRNHYEEEHVKPSQNPMKFVKDNLATALGLDADGHSKAQPMGLDPSKQGQTPVSRAEATPMSREPSMKGQGSAGGAKPTDLVKAIAAKTGTPKPDSGTQGGESITVPAKTSGADGTWPMATIDPQNLLQLGGIESGGGGAIFDMSVYRAITPNDTPESSKDSASSEPNSDVSEGVALNVQLDMGLDVWNPFGGGPNADLDATELDFGGVDMGYADDSTMPLVSWDDVNPEFSKEFALSLDTGMYSLDTT